jgi:hypothetical protein
VDLQSNKTELSFKNDGELKGVFLNCDVEAHLNIFFYKIDDKELYFD